MFIVLKAIFSTFNMLAFFRVLLMFGLPLLSIDVMAADELGDGTCKLVNLLTGKWLFAFTILAVLGGGAALLFGGEITDGIKKIATIVTIVGIILATSSILTLVFSRFGGVAC
ncbi:hypothetical protein [Methylotenera sp.]|uniref:hypothetical protein n=1 Tax=Methylotenera sp. TaxID=2051956 RepID=UPI002ED8272C